MIWQTCWWRGRKERCNLVKYSEPAITVSTAEDDTYSSHHGPGHFRGGCQTGRNNLNLNILREISLLRGFLIAFFSCVSDFFLLDHGKAWCLHIFFKTQVKKLVPILNFCYLYKFLKFYNLSSNLIYFEKYSGLVSVGSIQSVTLQFVIRHETVGEPVYSVQYSVYSVQCRPSVPGVGYLRSVVRQQPSWEQTPSSSLYISLARAFKVTRVQAVVIC